MSSPHPFQAQNWKGHGRPNFQATPSKFSKSIQLLKIFKWYYYDFLIFLLVSNFQKNPKAFMSISKGVREQKHSPFFLVVLMGSLEFDFWNFWSRLNTPAAHCEAEAFPLFLVVLMGSLEFIVLYDFFIPATNWHICLTRKKG